ncbi:hypothetical protein PoB_000637100 [Plakobranchus ocellatus]|uniref:Uncharacterized protein n=1 Tax=Plakobranchus ocellatus TaxID=259542 RepID=A0AAV3XY32_9GAST|nr:hypothetical protein PoB_000637100 [Plakobranchus ocellatus]
MKTALMANSMIVMIKMMKMAVEYVPKSTPMTIKMMIMTMVYKNVENEEKQKDGDGYDDDRFVSSSTLTSYGSQAFVSSR